MPVVTGNIRNFGLKPAWGKQLTIRFRPSKGGVGNQSLVAPSSEVSVKPDANGGFSISLVSTDNLRPDDIYYLIEVNWLNETPDGAGYVERDILPFRLYVPIVGGFIGDMLRTERDNQFIFVGENAPNPAVDGTWWIDEAGILRVRQGGMWVLKSELTLVTAYGTPREQYVGTNLSAARIPWQGPVYWITTATSGFPVNAQTGDSIMRVAESDEVIVISDAFSRPDGPAGVTAVGEKSWQTNGIGTPSIVSQFLRVTGHASGLGYTWINAGRADCIYRARIGNPGATRQGSLVARRIDDDNCLLIALRTDGAGDNTARLVSRVGGVSTVIASLGSSFNSSDLIAVVCRGTSIRIEKNGGVLWSGELVDNMSGTGFGMYVHNADQTLSLSTMHIALEA